jgi:multidrug efflux pump subunit AcrB
MNESFTNMAQGLVLAILLVYVLMVVLFQSLKDPLIVLVSIPGALVGIILFLWATGTTINVVSLMGSIMAVGIAASNATLLVSYANDLRMEGYSVLKAVTEAGKTRLRPILMTALAMILGMIPMAIGLGEGSEQNAPLARAVIGGLIIATLFTLFVVPVVYAGLYRGKGKGRVSLLEDQEESAHVVA